MKITIVIVLYNQKVESSKTFISLNESLMNVKGVVEDLGIILYDNSPEKQNFNPHQYQNLKLSYVHDKRNMGIATAYNYAFDCAQEYDSEWLLLLDHDTEITPNYINKIFDYLDYEKNVVALVPMVNSGGTMISPVHSSSLRPLNEERPSVGLQCRPIMAINSGTLVRLSFLKEIGGFNEEFPLDYLDHWLFYEIYAREYKVYILNVYLEHDLSVMNYNNVSYERYQSILDAEINFYKNYKKDMYKMYRKQLLKRLIKQILLVKNKKVAFYTLRRFLSMKG
ncbi:GT2 family glycosyltransferase [Salirhabdus euzebyi]|uniref:GT2 family glycosyltransferase n=1 Tax=Salirhabdus euzebyi TaxID=394506 RepID=A0A841Q7G3_9BACI|nr:glycosyltransferase [Salirhabdus euzebyi]MBB6454509.1 GT2 family glycosyltransferase [Salirhabdus euzebyi]